MDLIKAQLARLQQQLAGLSISQRMLVAALVVIMGMTLVYWARYAGAPEMVPVLDQPFKPDEIARVTGRLRSQRIDYKVVGDRIMVPAERALDVLADLTFEQLVPQNTQIGYDVASSISPWASNTQVAHAFNQAKEMRLGETISRFPGVASATVMLDPTDDPGIGRSRTPTAAIVIQTRHGMADDARVPPRKLAMSAAAAVAGAQSGLQRKEVHVVIDGTSVAIPDDDDGNSTGSFADGISEQRHREEEFQESKIRDHFSFIPGLIATVTVDIDNTRQQVQKKEYDPKNAVQQEHEVSSRTDETHTDNPAPAEAGAGANLPVSLGEPAATGGNSTSSSTDEQKTSYDNYVGEVNTVLSIPAGRPTIVSATVRVPRSYFVREFGGSNAADAKPPDDAVLDGFIQKRLADMRSEVKAMMVLKSDADVFVTTFNDTAQAMIVADARAGRTGGLGSLSVQSILGRYAKQVAVGMLAVVSLGMVLMIVRKGAPAPVVAVEPEPEPPHRLSSGEHVAGEAGEGEAMLDGMELDEDTVKAQQMIAQVSTMVKENPDAAATLVKRWLNRA